MGKEKCGSCEHFRQHYAFDKRRIFRVYCGHCTISKVKRRRPDADACENYKLSEPDENAFVTKEYLSKALLDHVLSLELLPQINGPEDRAGE